MALTKEERIKSKIILMNWIDLIKAYRQEQVPIARIAIELEKRNIFNAARKPFDVGWIKNFINENKL